MLKFIFFTIIIFILLKMFVSKNATVLLKVNPYIQTLIGFIISFGFVILISSKLIIGLYIYTVTMYLGLVFQEYYQKLSFKGEQC